MLMRESEPHKHARPQSGMLGPGWAANLFEPSQLTFNVHLHWEFIAATQYAVMRDASVSVHTRQGIHKAFCSRLGQVLVG